MKNRILLLVLCQLFFSFFIKAQEQPLKRKPGFSLDAKAMTELGLTEAQKTTIEGLRSKYRVLRSKFELEGRKLDTLVIKRQDSVLTSVQKEKVTAIREVLSTDNKPNPGYRKTLVLFDPKVIEELSVTAEQQKKFTAIQRDYNNERRSAGEKFGKVTTDAVAEQEAILTDTQKQKVAAIRAEIAEYNKKIQ